MIASETRGMGSLARWYAEPLGEEEAAALLRFAQAREQALLKRGGKSHLSPLLRLIALHWLGEQTDSYYQHLKARQTSSVHAQLLLLLIHGQLQMSGQVKEGMDELDEAFERMRLLLRPQDYFAVVKRHKLLRQLPPSPDLPSALPLKRLLITAAVIERMRGGVQ